MTVVDIIAEGQPSALSVHWPAAGPSPRPIETATIDPLRRQLEVLYQAEQDHRDAEVPVARRALGQMLWSVLDGPERRLTRAMEATVAQGEAMDLVIRLRVKDELALADHPATMWRWELLSPTTGGHPTADGRVRLVVQMGDVEPGPTPRVLEHGGLRIVFMAYSPEGGQALLDYEAEEERILKALERPIREHRARVEVVEDGTLAELERRLQESPADVVHLTGHGIVTPAGPRLILEDDLGRPDAISPEALLRVLKRAAKRPDLVVIGSCHSAEGRDGTPSFAAALVAGGMPAVLGWVQPVRDDVATAAAADLYRRLCGGETPAQAVAFVREQLRDADRGEKHPSHAWGTLHLLMRDARGFRVETHGTNPLPKTSMGGEALYQYLGVTGGMRVLERGFIGRRRQLQRLLRILRTGREDDHQPLAGAVVLGMKGVGKSCLVGRALDRHRQDYGSTGIVVLHGALDDVMVMQQFAEAARKREDGAAEAILQRDDPVQHRVQRLLAAHWSSEPIVVVLDDFEQNLELRDDGDAVPSAHAAALLEVLLPACQGNRPKLLVTTTASFRMPFGKERVLAEVALGSFEPPMLRKLWVRMPDEDRAKVSPAAWAELGERLGRNARVLDWARTLLRGKTPEEVEVMAREAGETIPEWKGNARPSDEHVAELARLFLRTLAMEETRKRLSEDALTFVKRARVYESPVPQEAFAGLVDGLAVELDRDITVLQNLGMLEVGEMDGQRAHRVSPLVEPDFEVDDPERWHSVAAAFWEQASKHQGTGEQFERTMMAWEHALAGCDASIADRCTIHISHALERIAHFRRSYEMANLHLERFPDSEPGLLWAGRSAERAGHSLEGWQLYERGESLARARGASNDELNEISWEGARILYSLGRTSEAMERNLAIVEHERARGLKNKHVYVRALNSFGSCQRRLGDASSARRALEECVIVKAEIYGEESLSVSVSLHELAHVLLDERDVKTAIRHLQRSIEIDRKILGTDEHPSITASLQLLAHANRIQGRTRRASDLQRQALHINRKVFQDDQHPEVKRSESEMGITLQESGHQDTAVAYFTDAIQETIVSSRSERASEILMCLGAVLEAREMLAAARDRLFAELRLWATCEPSLALRVARNMHELGLALWSLGRGPAACAVADGSLTIQEEVLGKDSLDLAHTLHGLGLLFLHNHNLERARSLFNRTRMICNKADGPKAERMLALVLHGEAKLAEKSNDLGTARRLLESALEAFGVSGAEDDDLDVSSTVLDLSLVLSREGDATGSSSLLKRGVCALLEDLDIRDGARFARLLSLYGKAVARSGDHATAASLLARRVELLKEAHGHNVHPDTLDAMCELGKMLLTCNTASKALSVLGETVSLWDALPTEQRPHSRAEAMRALGMAMASSGQLNDATNVLERALGILNAVGEPSDVRLRVALLDTLAEIVGSFDLPRARALLEQSLEIGGTASGATQEGKADHILTLQGLIRVCLEQKDWEACRGLLERLQAVQVDFHGSANSKIHIARTLSDLASVLIQLGQDELALEKFREVVRIQNEVFGTVCQEHTAEVEVAVGELLIRLGRVEEARAVLTHAYGVLRAKNPKHPAMSILLRRHRFPPSDPQNLVALALETRARGGTVSGELADELAAFRAAGTPHAEIATFLDAFARGEDPVIEPGLPAPIVEYLERARASASMN